MDKLLHSEVSARIDAISFALQSYDAGDASAIFMAELDRLRQAVEKREAFGSLGWFLSTDPSFARLCQDLNIEGAELDGSYLEDEPKRGNWIQDSRRQLYSFVYFIETIRQAFERINSLNPGVSSATDKSSQIELLADARRRLEMDAASGWRRTTEARLKFGLVLPCVSPPSGIKPSGIESIRNRLAELVWRRSN